MEFRIADTFTTSLTKLTSQEQKAVKTTAFDLQLNPAHPSLHFHKLDRSRDPNFWSIYVNMDLRLIVHRTDASLLLCYVDHHDNAYDWASRRKIQRHPKTGAAQLVEIRETIQQVIAYPVRPQPQPALFTSLSPEDLLSYGIPPEWIPDVQQATEDTLFDITDHLPQEAAEALLELATGGRPKLPTPIPADTDPFQHPDAQRRFRVMGNQAELERALAYPWEKWTVFLHPAQRHLVERTYTGPTRISGSAGTGKTIVALHRAIHLAQHHPEARILLTTFSSSLADALHIKLERLAGNQPDLIRPIQVAAIQPLALDLFTTAFGSPILATPQQLKSLLQQSIQPDDRFTSSFLWSEWNEVVDARQITTWEDYRDVPRLGRKTRIGSKQRERLWEIFQSVRASLHQQQHITWATLFQTLTHHIATQGSPFDFAIVDECQDMGIPEIQFFAQIGAKRPDSLFFTGDLGQRIFQQPFSWKALGISIQGRSHTLTINYRTSHQIRTAADKLLPNAISDVDGNTEQRQHTISVFNGTTPSIQIFDTPEDECQAVVTWIRHHLAQGLQPEEIGLFVRDIPQLERAIAAITQAGSKSAILNNHITAVPEHIAISTMHLAKGLEFRAVAVIACDDEVIPQQERIETISDESDLEEVYNTERHLLYVACTRARDYLLITGVDPASEFLDDF